MGGLQKKMKMKLQFKLIKIILHSNRCFIGKILQIGSKWRKFILVFGNIHINSKTYIKIEWNAYIRLNVKIWGGNGWFRAKNRPARQCLKFFSRIYREKNKTYVMCSNQAMILFTLIQHEGTCNSKRHPCSWACLWTPGVQVVTPFTKTICFTHKALSRDVSDTFISLPSLRFAWIKSLPGGCQTMS